MIEEIQKIIDEDVSNLYDWLKNVRDYIDDTLEETKTENGIDALELAQRVNNMSFLFYEAKGNVHVISNFCGLKERISQNEQI